MYRVFLACLIASGCAATAQDGHGQPTKLDSGHLAFLRVADGRPGCAGARSVNLTMEDVDAPGASLAFAGETKALPAAGDLFVGLVAPSGTGPSVEGWCPDRTPPPAGQVLYLESVADEQQARRALGRDDDRVTAPTRIAGEPPHLPHGVVQALERSHVKHLAVLMRVCTDERGRVTEATFLVPARAPDDFKNAYVAAVSGWKYSPAIIDAKPAPYCRLLNMAYHILPSNAAGQGDD